MKIVDWHPEELIDKHLAGELSDAERTKLDAHLAECVACRFEALVVEDLADEAAADEDGDVGDLAKLVRLAVSSEEAEAELAKPAPRSGKRRVSTGLVVGALVLVAGSAAALYQARRASEPPADVAVPVLRPATSLEVPVVPTGVAPPPAEEPEADAVPSAEPSTPAPAASAATAASLFAEANNARRAGQRERALQLYRRLQSQYPDSAEAKLSKATVGRMMLDAEDPAAAVDAYDGYLKEGDGKVSEEALVGRATALQRLGKAEEEKAAWQALLAKYPKSIHAGRARARLAELDAPK